MPINCNSATVTLFCIFVFLNHVASFIMLKNTFKKCFFFLQINYESPSRNGCQISCFRSDFASLLFLTDFLRNLVVVVVVVYPTPSEGWGHGGRPWSPRRRATPQGLDQRS